MSKSVRTVIALALLAIAALLVLGYAESGGTVHGLGWDGVVAYAGAVALVAAAFVVWKGWSAAA